MNHQSSLFDLEEHVAATLVAAISVVVTFVGYASYLAWAIPLAALIAEKRSDFVKLCAGQSLALTVVMFLCHVVTKMAQQGRNDNWLLVVPMGIVALAMSVIQVICLIFGVLLAYYAYKRKVFEIPVITETVKSLLKVNLQ